MKIAAVICEFDPFHNGHEYLIEETRRRTGCDGVICIMSGSFTQRGRPAVCDKWARAEMALKCGADVVAELPFVYAVSSAQYFALGGVGLAGAAGADVLAFGIESDEETVRELALRKGSETFGDAVREKIDAGASYARAASEWLSDGARLRPNDILACEYIAASMKLGWAPEFCMVPRAGAGHGERPAEGGNIASAGAIRDLLAEGRGAEAEKYMPEQAAEILRKWLETERPVTSEDFSAQLSVRLRTADPETLEKLPFGSGGIARHILKNACAANSWEKAVTESTSKRYASSRISRFLVWALVMPGEKNLIEPDERYNIFERGFFPYLRFLGAGSGKGEKVLAEVCKRAASSGTAPVISLKDYLKEETCGTALKMALWDNVSQSVYDSVLTDPSRFPAGRNYTEKFIRI